MMTRGFVEYVKENVDDVRHFAAHLGGGELPSLDAVAAGQGALVKVSGKMVAAYRSADGRLHLHSAACTHAGCMVRWNPFEQCWDCPCHGSQFSVDGAPLQGPATRPLAQADPPEP
jgi:Rieske Fe-S protein